MGGVKFIQRYLQDTCRLLTTEKFQTWILKDLWPQVNRICRSHYLQVFPRVYLQVTFVDLDPCPALIINLTTVYRPICHIFRLVRQLSGHGCVGAATLSQTTTIGDVSVLPADSGRC